MRIVNVGTEWRVYTDFNEIWADIPVQRDRVLSWIADNIDGEEGEGKDWRLSSYSIAPYVAFICEKNAILFLLRFG